MIPARESSSGLTALRRWNAGRASIDVTDAAREHDIVRHLIVGSECLCARRWSRNGCETKRKLVVERHRGKQIVALTESCTALISPVGIDGAIRALRAHYRATKIEAEYDTVLVGRTDLHEALRHRREGIAVATVDARRVRPNGWGTASTRARPIECCAGGVEDHSWIACVRVATSEAHAHEEHSPPHERILTQTRKVGIIGRLTDGLARVQPPRLMRTSGEGRRAASTRPPRSEIPRDPSRPEWSPPPGDAILRFASAGVLQGGFRPSVAASPLPCGSNPSGWGVWDSRQLRTSRMFNLRDGDEVRLRFGRSALRVQPAVARAAFSAARYCTRSNENGTSLA